MLFADLGHAQGQSVRPASGCKCTVKMSQIVVCFVLRESESGFGIEYSSCLDRIRIVRHSFHDI
jgi:hypothetical protein